MSLDREAPERPVAVVTGASSGIGAATARALHKAGFECVLGARRVEQVQEVADAVGGRARPLDVTESESVDAFFAELDRLDLLVNNAGLALGQDPIASIKDEDLRVMWETNVMGVLRATRSALPLLRQGPNGHVINVGSSAAGENYAGGVGYTSSKQALRAVTQTLRLELLGEPIRVSEVAPGLTRTNFRWIRYRGNRERVEEGYRGMVPLRPEDVASCIVFVATCPPEVNVDLLVVRPRDQASNWHIHRRSDS
jgi:NADP-dependent 3-hydroxy acid dehydrogenase YdfG